MDAAELEDWYEQQRERLEERAYDALQKGDTGAQERFDKEYRALIAAYQRKQDALYNGERRGEQVRKPIARLRACINEWSAAPGIWLSARVKAFKKWRFDRKVRRLLR